MYSRIRDKLNYSGQILRDMYRDVGEVGDFYRRYELFEKRDDYLLVDEPDHFCMARRVHHSIADMDEEGRMINIMEILDDNSPTPSNADTWLINDYAGELDLIWDDEPKDGKRMIYAFFMRLLGGRSHSRLLLISEAKRFGKLMKRIKENGKKKYECTIQDSRHRKTTKTGTSSQTNTRHKAA